MTAEGVVTIILGSTVIGTVLGTLLGAQLEADKQREEEFRKRMVDSAVDFLKHITAFYKAVYAADAAIRRSRAVKDEYNDPGTALDEAHSEIMGATFFVPVQRVVFPGKAVPDAANDLVDRTHVLFDAVSNLGTSGADRDVDAAYGAVNDAQEIYADLVNRAIREQAFRERWWRRPWWRRRRSTGTQVRGRAAGDAAGNEPTRG